MEPAGASRSCFVTAVFPVARTWVDFSVLRGLSMKRGPRCRRTQSRDPRAASRRAGLFTAPVIAPQCFTVNGENLSLLFIQICTTAKKESLGYCMCRTILPYPTISVAVSCSYPAIFPLQRENGRVHRMDCNSSRPHCMQ